MAGSTRDVTIKLTPETRTTVVDVAQQLAAEHGERLASFSKLLYCSHHTTAGFLEQSLCARIRHRRESVEALVQSAKKLFPEGAAYWHDRMEMRSELTEEQKVVEPLNADSHLAYIGLGMENCVTYDNNPDVPVYFIDLDGVYQGTHRLRKATVVGFNSSETVMECTLRIPVSPRVVDSVNVFDPRSGFAEQLNELLRIHKVQRGKIELSLPPTEQHAGLTMNEYETLLMKHDLMEVLRNPFRFMAHEASSIVHNPKALPQMAKGYIKYDLVRVVDQVIKSLHLNESLVERVFDRIAAVSNARRLRLKRSVTMLINTTAQDREGSIVRGTYQSPILLQWRRATDELRRVNVRLIRLE